jgi:integration host factor subunit beta
MTRTQLVKLISYHYDNLTLKVIQECVDVIFDEMVNAFINKDRIEIRDFGNFTTKTHKGKIVRHPSSKRLIKLKEHNVIHYKVGKALFEQLNK